MEVQQSRQRRVERQVEPSAMTLSTGVYWIPVLHDACRSALTASSVSTFKKKSDELKASEEKVKHLKRHNADLASVTCKFDKKLEPHEHDSMKKCKTVPLSTQNTSANRTAMMTKDRSVKTVTDQIVERLREKCQEFSRLVISHQDVSAEITGNLHIYNDMSRLEAVLQQAAKERLQLEKRLGASKHVDASIEVQLNNVTSLKVINCRLESQLSQLAGELQDKQKLETEFKEILLKNTELNIINSDLQKQLDELGKCMKKLTEQNEQLEAEKQCCAEQLRTKELEYDNLIQARETDNCRYMTSLSQLEDQVATLQQQCHNLKTDKLQMLMEIDQMKQTYEQQLLSCFQSSTLRGIDTNRNMSNYTSPSSDCLQLEQSEKSSKNCNIADHDQTGALIGDTDVTKCKTGRGMHKLFCKEQRFAEDQSVCVRVFTVLYDYDPYQSSPNDQPDTELPLTAGEHVYITGDIDEDGFYNGMLTDGRCGLIPSNFVRQLCDEEGQELDEMVTLQTSERLQQMDDGEQGVDGDQLLLDDSDVCHVGASQFQPIYLSSQLHSTHTQSSVVHPGYVQSGATNRNDTSWRRPSSEPCAETDSCLKSDLPTFSNASGSVELLKQTASDNCAQDDYCRHISDVHRPSAPMLEESYVSDISCVTSTVAVDDKYRLNCVPAIESGLTGSVWRKVKPPAKPVVNDAQMTVISLQDTVCGNVAGDATSAVEMQSSVEHREQCLSAESQRGGSVHAEADVGAGSHIISVTTSRNVDKATCCLPRPSASDECERKADDDVDSDNCETAYDLTDNNVVTGHQIRDDIPDSELIDYSDDGGESLFDSSSCANVNEQVRIFIALFDYDPATMSPNPDAVDSELPFSEGELIKVFGDQDADGFYYGECNGRRGLVPSNIVAVIEVDDAEAAMQLLHDNCQSVAPDSSFTSSRASSQVSMYLGHQQVNGGGTNFSLDGDRSVHYMVAMYSYNPIELSPNVDADQELAFSRGDVIAVYGDADDDGFYLGELDGRSGLVPSNFLQEAPLSYSVS